MRQKSMVHVVRQRLSQISMEKFVEKPPRFGVVHWNGKMVKDVAMGGNPGRARLWCSVRRENYYRQCMTPGASQADTSIEMLTL